MRLKRYPGRAPPNGARPCGSKSIKSLDERRLVGGNTGSVPKPRGLNLQLEPGVSGLDLAAALVGWLQRECGAVAGEYQVEGNVVSIPLQVPARRVACAGTRLHARLTRA